MNKIRFIIYMFLSLSLLTANAQVTIGSKEKPKAGAILDLKQDNAVGDNSTKGMMLPRVDLTAKNQLYPMFSKGYDKNLEDASHTGLVVYNVDNCGLEEGQGTYVWDGNEWLYLGIQDYPEVYEYKDQNGNPFLARSFGDAGIWMIQNLAATTYDTTRDNPSDIIKVAVPNITYPNDDPLLTKKYPWMGVFYNFETAMNGGKSTSINTQRIQGICPSGWHVPSNSEWAKLETELINNTTKYTTRDTNFKDDPTFTDQPSTATSGENKYGWTLMSAALDPCQVPDGKAIVDINGTSLKYKQGGFAIRLVGAMNVSVIDGYGEKAGFWVSYFDGANGRNRVYIRYHANSNMVCTHNNPGNVLRSYSIRCVKNDLIT